MTEYNPLANETHINVYSVLGKYTTFTICTQTMFTSTKECTGTRQPMREDDGLLEGREPPKYKGGNETSNCNSTILYSLAPLALM